MAIYSEEIYINAEEIYFRIYLYGRNGIYVVEISINAEEMGVLNLSA